MLWFDHFLQKQQYEGSQGNAPVSVPPGPYFVTLFLIKSLHHIILHLLLDIESDYTNQSFFFFISQISSISCALSNM